MKGKTFVVTGSNRGLGLELIRQLSDNEGVGKVFALCRKTSEELTNLAKTSDKIQLVQDVDVSQDEVVNVLQSTFDSTPIDVLIHNAGAFGPPDGFENMMEVFQSQTLENITMDRMRFCFELNTLGPLRVTKALLPNLKRDDSDPEDPTKIIIITSLMGSMSDNTSGNIYGYRSSKAAVNMVGKSLARDLKKDNIAVGLIHPGMVFTGFGGLENQQRMNGQKDVEPSVKGVLDAVDAVTVENTGAFLHGNYGEGIKPLEW